MPVAETDVLASAVSETNPSAPVEANAAAVETEKPKKPFFIDSEAAEPFLTAETIDQNVMIDGDRIDRSVRLLKEIPPLSVMDGETYRPLKRTDFAPGFEWMVLEHRAQIGEAHVAKLREQAEDEKAEAAGGVKAKKRKLSKLKGEMSKLLAELKGTEGVDLAAILEEQGLDASMFLDSEDGED